MKLNLPQYLLFMFVSTWVLCEVAGASYWEKLGFASFLTVEMAWLENAHGKMLAFIRESILMRKKA